MLARISRKLVGCDLEPPDVQHIDIRLRGIASKTSKRCEKWDGNPAAGIVRIIDPIVSQSSVTHLSETNGIGIVNSIIVSREELCRWAYSLWLD